MKHLLYPKAGMWAIWGINQRAGFWEILTYLGMIPAQLAHSQDIT
jgi:hypothetical protein